MFRTGTGMVNMYTAGQFHTVKNVFVWSVRVLGFFFDREEEGTKGGGGFALRDQISSEN